MDMGVYVHHLVRRSSCLIFPSGKSAEAEYYITIKVS